MVWLVDKKIIYHILDLGYERVKIPIRTKFEFEVREGVFVPGSLSIERLYNKDVLLNQFPNLQSELLEQDIDNTVKTQISNYLIDNGYLSK